MSAGRAPWAAVALLVAAGALGGGVLVARHRGHGSGGSGGGSDERSESAGEGGAAVVHAAPLQSPLESLLEDLGRDDARAVGLAINALSTQGGEDVLRALRHAIHDPNQKVAMMAQKALGDRYRKGLAPLGDVTAMVADPALGKTGRFGALAAAGARPSPEAAAYLSGLAKTGSPEERSMACSLVSAQGPAAAVPVLLDALADGDPWVRNNAAAALRRLANAGSVNPKTQVDFAADAAAWRGYWTNRGVR